MWTWLCCVSRAYCMTQFSLKQLCRVPWWSAGENKSKFCPVGGGISLQQHLLFNDCKHCTSKHSASQSCFTFISILSYFIFHYSIWRGVELPMYYKTTKLHLQTWTKQLLGGRGGLGVVAFWQSPHAHKEGKKSTKRDGKIATCHSPLKPPVCPLLGGTSGLLFCPFSLF